MIDEKKLIEDLRSYCGKQPYLVSENIWEIINSQPQIGGWIPCSERLPTKEECIKNDCRFIVSDGNRVHQGTFDYEINHFVWHSCSGIQMDRVTIAWMPLPNLYKEEV